MKLSPAFDTSIDQLLALQNQMTIFLSTWDKGHGHLDFPDEMIKPAIEEFPLLKNDYFFSDELIKYKHDILQGSYLPLSKKSIGNLGIFSNGTSAAMLAYMTIKDAVASIQAMLIAPTYFTHIKTLREIKADIYYIPAIMETTRALLPLTRIIEAIKKYNLNLVVITIPLFGAGLSPEMESIIELCEICENYNCYLMIDFLYGGMRWIKHNSFEVKCLWEICIRYKYVILIESLSKRIFLNGIKSSLVGASADFIHQMELKSVHLAGSLSYSQISILQLLYAKDNKSFVEHQIAKNVEYFSSNYQLIKTLCRNTPIHILPCNEGYFCLVEIPVIHETSSMEIAVDILKKTNVMTIPHDRYLLFTPQKYTFRVNLSMEKDKLMAGVSQLLQLYL